MYLLSMAAAGIFMVGLAKLEENGLNPIITHGVAAGGSLYLIHEIIKMVSGSITVVSDTIETLQENQVIDDFVHLANMLYIYKKLTGKNYEE